MANRNALLSIGDPAPDFTLDASDGSRVSLHSFLGKSAVILVFYPGDNTPLCQSQLCELREDWETIRNLDAVAFGINPAKLESHAAFATHNRLPFPLLIDEKATVAAEYGCALFFGMIRRTVYVADKRGKIIFAERGRPKLSQILDSIKRHGEAL